MKRRIKPYLTFTKSSLQRNLSYRANSIIFFLGDIMLIAVTFYLWLAIYKSSSESIIKGFDVNEMMIYVILSFVTSTIVSADINHSIYTEVKDGSIATYLMKPINYELRYLFEVLGNFIYNFILIFIVGFGVVIFMAIKYSVTITFGNIMLYFISTFLGLIVNFYYSYGFALLSFKITNMWGLAQIMNAISQLLSGVMIPLVFFPNIIQKLFDFLPFKSIVYTPCMLLLGKLNTGEIIKSIIIQVVWIIIMIIVSKGIWKKLVKQLTILGG